MKPAKSLFTILILFFSSNTLAGYFEYCYLDGKVILVSKNSSAIELLVNRSVASQLEGERSYSPEVCSAYTGRTVKIIFRTKKKKTYTVGQRLKVRQIIADVLTSDGMATSKSWEVVAP